MHIKKQRLATPGPTPLYPPAMHAMMGSDIHHRTEDFRKIYRGCLAGLKEVMGTSNDVLLFASSGTGAMDAAVSNLFSKGDKVIVCVAGKFGERWAEIARAYGLDATVITVPYGDAVSLRQVEEALSKEPAARGVFVQASESSTGAAHDVKAMGASSGEDGRHFRRRCHHRLRHDAARDRWLGARCDDQWIAKGLHDSAGAGLPLDQPEGVALYGNRDAAALLFQPEEGEEKRRRWRIHVDPRHFIDSRAGRSARLYPAAWACRT